MPFIDPMVGGVGMRPNVFAPSTSLWRRVADWIIDTRYLDYVPATGRSGAVVCLSGRTAAYRRSVVLEALPQLEEELFFGRRCIAGDDGRLTWLVLVKGFRTMHQSTARALSIFPTTFREFCKQRIRWSRNSYRCYLTALWKGWLWQVPLISQLAVLQVLLAPVIMGAIIYYVSIAVIHPDTTTALALALIWSFLSRVIRSVSHLRRRPGDLLLLPLITAAIMTVTLPIETYAFLTMNKHGWLTRRTDLIGGEGQNIGSLTPD